MESIPIPLEKSDFYKMKGELYLGLKLLAGLCDRSSELQEGDAAMIWCTELLLLKSGVVEVRLI